MTDPSHPSVFSCRQCGECCLGERGILVTDREALALADFLGLKPNDFCRLYLVDTPAGPQVAAVEGACVFLTGGRCRVHPVKPRICREWPFLPALLAHADEFEAAKEACPGIEPGAQHEDFVKDRGGWEPPTNPQKCIKLFAGG